MAGLTPEQQAELAEFDAELDKQIAAEETNKKSSLTPEQQAELAEFDAELDKQIAAEEGVNQKAVQDVSAQMADLSKFDPLLSTDRTPKTLSDAKAVTDTFTQGLIPFEDEMKAGLTAVSPISDTGYDEALAANREEAAASAAQLDPTARAGIGMAGAVVNPLGATGRAAGPIKKIAGQALAGGVEAAGVSNAESLPELGSAALEGGLTGGLVQSATLTPGGVHKVRESLGDWFEQASANSLEKSMGITDTLGMSKDYNAAVNAGKVKEGDFGRLARREGIASYLGNTTKGMQSRLSKAKNSAGVEVGEHVESARDVKVDDIVNGLEARSSKLADKTSTGALAHQNFLKGAIKRAKKPIKDAKKDWEKLRKDYLLDRGALEHSIQRESMLQAGGSSKKLEGLQEQLDAMDEAISKVEDNLAETIFRSAKSVAKDRTGVGKDIKDFRDAHGKQAGAVDEYSALSDELTASMQNPEEYKKALRRYELLSFLDKPVTRKAAKDATPSGTDKSVAQYGLATGRASIVGLGLGRAWWKVYGDTLMAAGFKGAEHLSKLRRENIKTLVDAIESGASPSAIKAMNYQLLQTDEKYRKSVTEYNDKQGKK